jgi:glutamyl-tRNA synthetase
MTTPRLRFAPSPTGYLHIGGARTALFNWLWARKTGGKFILRVEDTDVARNTRESVEAIFTAMRWLGLDWDEGPSGPDDEGGGPNGPYFQSKRLGLYREHAERLIRSGHAYRCYATKEDIDAARMALPEKQREAFRFVSPWRDKKAELDRPYVVRIKAPAGGEVAFDDLVFGTIRTPGSALRDEILLRENGMPLYNFGCVVDDITMEISHVIRGKDHIINTPPQVLLYRAFGAKTPAFGHLPMLMKNAKEKLSKRDGAVGVGDYAAQGYLPDGLLSYLVRFGWSFGDEELFTKDKLVELFDWSRVSKSDGVYDFKKCKAINQKFIAKVATVEQLAQGVLPFLAARELPVREGHPRLLEAVATVRERAETLASLADAMDFYFRARPVMDDKAVEKFLLPECAPVLDQLAEWAERTVPERDGRAVPFADAQQSLDGSLRELVTHLGLEMKAVGQPARVALTGRGASPDLASVMLVLGPAVSALRLREAASTARARSAPGTP